MTRKEMMVLVADEMRTNARAVLAGHGIAAAVLQEVIVRPDIAGYLGGILYSMAAAKKGATGLKKAPNFRIFGYKNSGSFLVNCREDIETFVSGLNPDDAAKFTNQDNTVVVYVDKQAIVDPATPTEDVICSGARVGMTFESAIKKETKGLGGGMYLVIMWGDSALRKSEAATAERAAAKNEAKQAKRNPAKLKAELIKKKKAALGKINDARTALQQKAARTARQLQQYDRFGSQLGAKPGSIRSTMGKIGAMDARSGNQRAAVQNAMAMLTPAENKLVAMARKFMAKGDMRTAKSMVKDLDPTVANAVLNGTGGGDPVVAAKRKQIKAKIAQLDARAEQLILDLALAPADKKVSIKSMISKNNAAIKQLRDSLGTYKNMSITAYNKKAAILAETNAKIQTLLTRGANISQAINKAISEINATPAEKTLIKQQVAQAVAAGIPGQYAVQQSIQDNIVADDSFLGDNDDLDGADDLDSLIAGLI